MDQKKLKITLIAILMSSKDFNPITLFDIAKSISINVNIDNYEIKETVEFLSNNSIVLLNDIDRIFLTKELDKLRKRLLKKLNNRRASRSIRFDFFEIRSMYVLYQIASAISSKGEVASRYPSVTNLMINRIFNQLPSNLKEYL